LAHFYFSDIIPILPCMF